MAEYSTVTLSDATQILASYGLNPTAIERLAGGMANTSYVIHTLNKLYVMTVLDNHDLASAKSLVQLIDYLTAAGLSTPAALRNRNNDGVASWHSKPVIVKPYVAGKSLDTLPEELLPVVGRLLASIHSVPPPQNLSPGGRHLPLDWEEILALRPCPPLHDELSSASNALEATEWKCLPRGLVHGDLFGDNLLVADDNNLVALDWETATIEPFTLDIGICGVAFCRTEGQFDEKRFTELLSGYNNERPISQAERSSLFVAVRYANAMLAYHRYVRHNIRYPNPAKADLYQELLNFAYRLPSSSGEGST